MSCDCKFELPDPNTHTSQKLQTYHSCTQELTTYIRWERARWVPRLTPPLGSEPPQLQREFFWRCVRVERKRL